jgi:hypothetical protein
LVPKVGRVRRRFQLRSLRALRAFHLLDPPVGPHIDLTPRWQARGTCRAQDPCSPPGLPLNSVVKEPHSPPLNSHSPPLAGPFMAFARHSPRTTGCSLPRTGHELRDRFHSPLSASTAPGGKRRSPGIEPAAQRGTECPFASASCTLEGTEYSPSEPALDGWGKGHSPASPSHSPRGKQPSF